MSHIFTESMLGRFHDIEFQGFQWQQKTHFCIFYCQIRITITLQWSIEISGKAQCGSGIYKHTSWSQNLFEIPHDLQFTADFPMSTSVHFASPTPYFRGGGFFFRIGRNKTISHWDQSVSDSKFLFWKLDIRSARQKSGRNVSRILRFGNLRNVYE